MTCPTGRYPVLLMEKLVADSSPSMTFSSRQKVLAALLFASSVLNYLDRNALSALAPLIRRELHLSTQDYAFAVNGFLIAYAVMYARSGLILDRIGFRVGLAVFVASWSVACGLHAFVTERGLDRLSLVGLLGVAQLWSQHRDTIRPGNLPLRVAMPVLAGIGRIVRVRLPP